MGIRKEFVVIEADDIPEPDDGGDIGDLCDADYDCGDSDLPCIPVATYGEAALLEAANMVRLASNPFNGNAVTTVPEAVSTLGKGLPLRLGGHCWIVLELTVETCRAVLENKTFRSRRPEVRERLGRLVEPDTGA